MAIQKRKTLYPFAEMVEVLSEGTTVIDLLQIPEDTIVDKVLVLVKTPAVGAANLTVGDDDDADGFIVAADATAAEDTVYGDLIAEVGAYLKGATGATSGFGPIPKHYSAAGKEVKFALSAAPATSEGVYRVIIKGHRYSSD